MDKGIEGQDPTKPKKHRRAKGRPGAKPLWTSGAKTLVGTAIPAASRIWYTIHNGTLGEIYFPDVDQANTRSIRFVVTGSRNLFSDVTWDANHTVEWLEPGAPAARIHSLAKKHRYELTQEIVPDPLRDALLIRGRFVPATSEDLRLYVVVDAHVGDRGANNEAWAGDYKGEPMVFACRETLSLALASSPSMPCASVGYIGRSDGFTLLQQHKPLPDANFAPDGNVAMTFEVDFRSSGDGSFILAFAGGSNAAEAAQQARAGILEDFDRTREVFLRQWRDEQNSYRPIADLSGSKLDMYRVSTAVLQTHQSKRFPGGFVASLSLPWGFDRSDKDVGGYHVVWPRDLVETALGKLACGDAHSARSTLFYLACTQNADGGWSQNLWLDGTPHWTSIQMDAVALPLLLIDKLRREDALDGYQPSRVCHGATRFLLRHGPVTQQDRWETTPGYSPNTMAAEVAALLASADVHEENGHHDQARFLRDTADAWNDAIDELTYVEDTPLARKHGVRGYYLRMSPPQRIRAREIGHLRIRMPNTSSALKTMRAIDIISPGALALVRHGLRAPDDPHILDTVKLLDATLRHELTTGPGWTRSTADGYGEKKDGSPFEKTGIGRCWPLLAGERGHYELAAGHRDIALELLKTMARQTSECGMIPEQVWNARDIPKHNLFNGKPTGSGMPLVWAHAEYIKLLRSLHEGAVWDRIPQTETRYLKQRHIARFQIWTPEQRRGWLTRGKDLRLDLLAPSRVTWCIGRSTQTAETNDTGLGLHCVTLPLREISEAPAAATIHITTDPIDPIDPKSEQKRDSFTVRIRE